MDPPTHIKAVAKLGGGGGDDALKN